ncbi:hypothetical protein GQ457_08G033820 [Hibiscus cannabinus]
MTALRREWWSEQSSQDADGSGGEGGDKHGEAVGQIGVDGSDFLTVDLPNQPSDQRDFGICYSWGPDLRSDRSDSPSEPLNVVDHPTLQIDLSSSVITFPGRSRVQVVLRSGASQVQIQNFQVQLGFRSTPVRTRIGFGSPVFRVINSSDSSRFQSVLQVGSAFYIPTTNHRASG